jgi:hypothetical protein
MKVASDGCATGRRNPEIGASSVKNDLERLWWGTNTDLREVCGDLALRGMITTNTYIER